MVILKLKKTDSNLITIYQPIKSILKNTIIPYTWIRKNKYQYQCLLQSQADFLSDKVCWWRELEDGIKFLDVINCPNSKKQLFHLRSTSIAEEVNHIEECWNHLLSLKHKIPAYKIHVKSSLNKSGNLNLELFNLSDFSNNTKCDIDQQIYSSNSIEIEKFVIYSNSKTNKNSLQNLVESNDNEIDFFSIGPQQLGQECNLNIKNLAEKFPVTSTPIQISTPKTPTSATLDIVTLKSKPVAVKRKNTHYSSLNIPIKLFDEVDFLKKYDFLREQAKNSNTNLTLSKTARHIQKQCYNI